MLKNFYILNFFIYLARCKMNAFIHSTNSNKNYMKRLLLLVILGGLMGSSYAQQDPQVSMNKYNILPVNPGFAGSNGAICASLLYRQQWMGFDGAPKTMIFSGDMALPSFNSGAGLNIISDNVGFEKNVYLNANYAYHLQVGDGDLGIGLGIGLINKSLDGEWITPDKLNGIQQNPYADPAIPHSESHMVFDADFGLFYQVPQNSGSLFDVTQTIDTYVYRGLMELNNIGMAAAAALYQSVVGFVLVLGANAIVRKIDTENALF